MSHTPGPWTWRFMQGGGFSLCTPDRGMLIVMDFARRGMNSAQPRFAEWKGDRDRSNVGRMTKGEELGELHDHPDARLIAAAPALLEAAEAMLPFIHEHKMEGETEYERAVLALEAAIKEAKVQKKEQVQSSEGK